MNLRETDVESLMDDSSSEEGSEEVITVLEIACDSDNANRAIEATQKEKEKNNQDNDTGSVQTNNLEKDKSNSAKDKGNTSKHVDNVNKLNEETKHVDNMNKLNEESDYNLMIINYLEDRIDQLRKESSDLLKQNENLKEKEKEKENSRKN